MNTKVDISPKQERFIAIYLESGNIAESAKKAKVSRNAVYRWLNKGLADVIRDRQQQAVKTAINIMQTATLKATIYLLEVVENAQSPPADRLKAADLLTRNGLKAYEQNQLEMLADIENKLEEITK